VAPFHQRRPKVCEHGSSPKDSGSRECFLNLGSYTDIRQQHEFLYQAIGLSLLFLLHIDRFGTFGRVQVDLEFGRREGQSSSSDTTFLQLDCDSVEQSDRRRQGVVAGPVGQSGTLNKGRWDSLVVLAELSGFIGE
jgi:hypothetical protein